MLGKLLANSIITRYPFLLSDYQLVPIPLAKSRKRWRGFNQAEILCRSISAAIGLPVADVLVRKKSTKVQKDLKKDARIENVSGAFGVAKSDDSKDRDIFQIKNQNFILVDDVITTGSTMLEAVKVLKRNGAKSVWCLTVARD